MKWALNNSKTTVKLKNIYVWNTIRPMFNSILDHSPYQIWDYTESKSY